MPKSILTASADFTITSGTLAVGDTICGGHTLENVRKGAWKAFVEMDSSNECVAYIHAFCTDVDTDKSEDDEEILEVDIDSGNLSICDAQYFKTENGEDCGDLQDTADPFGSFFNGRGVVTQTGFGDGAYPMFISRLRGKIVEVTVHFIFEEMEEDTVVDAQAPAVDAATIN
jgi:hypothetical protein